MIYAGIRLATRTRTLHARMRNPNPHVTFDFLNQKLMARR